MRRSRWKGGLCFCIVLACCLLAGTASAQVQTNRPQQPYASPDVIAAPASGVGAPTAAAQGSDDASTTPAEEQYLLARQGLRAELARLRVSRITRPSLMVHTSVGWQAGGWDIHETVDGFFSVGADVGLSYRQFWNGRAGFSIGAGIGRSLMDLVRNEGSEYDFGRTDLYLDASLHFFAAVGGRFYLGPTLRAGYWRMPEALEFPEENGWGSYDNHVVPIGNAWVLTGGPHLGWLLGRRSDFDLNLAWLAGGWNEGSRWRPAGGAHLRFAYVFALGGGSTR